MNRDINEIKTGTAIEINDIRKEILDAFEKILQEIKIIQKNLETHIRS